MVQFGQNIQKFECQKIFCTLLLNFVKCLNKNWLEFYPFYMNESKQNTAKGSFMLKKTFFYQPGNFFCRQISQIWQNLLDFPRKWWYFMVFNKPLWNFTTSNKILHHQTMFLSNFMVICYLLLLVSMSLKVLCKILVSVWLFQNLEISD